MGRLKIKSRAMTADGVHGGVFKLIKPHIKQDSKILIAGSGQGAFEERLIKLLKVDPKNITSVDIAPENFKIKQINCKKVDLNNELPFSTGFFDIVISIEVIEHLENQWLFMRELQRVKKRNGYIAISSPNVEAIWSRIYYLFKGRLPYFSHSDYVGSGHITPLFSWNFKRLVAKNKLKIIKQDAVEYYFWIIPFLLKIKVPFKSVAFAYINLFLVK